MTKKKLLYIAPHLSTGGLPQFLYKKIEILLDEYEIYVVEYSDITGGVLVVQRNRILSKIDSAHFFKLGEDKNELISIIESIQPDYIHIEEIPEYFMDKSIARKIYTKDRKYKIFETSHDSSVNVNKKMFLPDKFLLISKYQLSLFESLGVDCDIVEYPIEYKDKRDRETCLKEMGLDPSYKHVINVGLWTSRKNQAEIVEYARELEEYKIKFHFIGNMADNFKSYWEPILLNLPDNCIIWNERSDVDKFYEFADLFLFTSRGNNNDKETSPLVIREAIGFNVPSLIYNLPVYMGMYDTYENIKYLSENGNNINKILNILGFEENKDFNRKVVKKYYENNSDSSELKIPIKESYNKNENKITFEFKENADEPFLVSIKDIDSKACIYSAKIGPAPAGSSWWMIPLPMHVINFQTDPTFGGFTIEFRNTSGDLLDTREIRLKDILIKKPIVNITNTEPIFINYEEFFVKDIYKKVDFKKLDTVFDIGANVGLWSSWIETKGANKIYCFEPNSIANNTLYEFTRGKKNYVISAKAIYQENTDLKFYSDPENSIISSVLESSGYQNSYTVTAITIEEALKEYGLDYVDLVKIDIEGAEFEIMEKLPENMFDKIGSFLIEYHDINFTDGTAKVESLEKKLKSNNYSIYKNIEHKYIYATKN
jgi:FkbM family methyltransferase